MRGNARYVGRRVGRRRCASPLPPFDFPGFSPIVSRMNQSPLFFQVAHNLHKICRCHELTSPFDPSPRMRITKIEGIERIFLFSTSPNPPNQKPKQQNIANINDEIFTCISRSCPRYFCIVGICRHAKIGNHWHPPPSIRR